MNPELEDINPELDLNLTKNHQKKISNLIIMTLKKHQSYIFIETDATYKMS
jgi:hypothetical protein